MAYNKSDHILNMPLYWKTYILNDVSASLSDQQLEGDKAFATFIQIFQFSLNFIFEHTLEIIYCFVVKKPKHILSHITSRDFNRDD